MILYGARGQAKVIYDLILSNNHLLEYLVDDNPPDYFPHHLNVYRPTPELLQDKASPQTLGNAVMNYFENPDETAAVVAQFESMHLQLKRNASERAADSIAKLIQRS